MPTHRMAGDMRFWQAALTGDEKNCPWGPLQIELVHSPDLAPGAQQKVCASILRLGSAKGPLRLCWHPGTGKFRESTDHNILGLLAHLCCCFLRGFASDGCPRLGHGVNLAGDGLTIS